MWSKGGGGWGGNVHKTAEAKEKNKITSNTGHIEVANTAAKLWKKTVEIEWYWLNQCWQIHTEHRCHHLDASRTRLQRLQPWKHLFFSSFFFKRERKNPPSLLIYQLVLLELVCDEVMKYYLSKTVCTFPRMLFNILQNLHIDASARWRKSRIYFSLYSSASVQNGQNTRCINSIFFLFSF